MIRLILSHETERRRAFFAFLLLGVASLLCVRSLWFVPVLWLVMTANIQVMSLHVWLASVLGLALPYWFATPFVIRNEAYDLPSAHFAGLTELSPVADFSSLTTFQTVVIVIAIVLALVSMAYYHRHSRYERLRLKQAYIGYAIVFGFALLVFVLQPDLYWLCLVMLAISSSPFISRMTAWIF